MGEEFGNVMEGEFGDVMGGNVSKAGSEEAGSERSEDSVS